MVLKHGVHKLNLSVQESSRKIMNPNVNRNLQRFLVHNQVKGFLDA